MGLVEIKRSCDFFRIDRLGLHIGCHIEMAVYRLLALALFLLVRGGVGDQLEISLNGDWSLSDSAGRVKAIKAQVPGVVHLDLM